MSTLDVFCSLTKMPATKASSLEITPERQAEIIETLREEVPVDDTLGPQRAKPILLLPVSTYVVEAKDPDAGAAYVSAKQPPFASHWGIFIGTLGDAISMIMHLVLRTTNAGERYVAFHLRLVDDDDPFIKIGATKMIGETKYSVEQLVRIGKRMIREFGNYHVLFWNCQIYAQCYLRVITDNDATFDQWTSADVTNLFLCALVIPAPFTTSWRLKRRIKERNLETEGLKAVGAPLTNDNEEPTEQDIFRLSDKVIDWLIDCSIHSEGSKMPRQPMKDSADKVGILRKLLRWITD
jgi:hypothetical protein